MWQMGSNEMSLNPTGIKGKTHYKKDICNGLDKELMVHYLKWTSKLKGEGAKFTIMFWCCLTGHTCFSLYCFQRADETTMSVIS